MLIVRSIKKDLEQRQHQEQLEKEVKRLPNGMFKCDNPKCQKEHDGSYGSGRFCSEHCRRVYIGLKSGKKRRLYKGTSHFTRLTDRSPYGTWICKQCNLIFETRALLQEHKHHVHPIENNHPWNFGLTKETDERIALSATKVSKTLKEGYSSGKYIIAEWTDEMRQVQSNNAKRRKLGGYHKHGGKGHRGRYHGYWCDSSWELAYVIYNLEHGIKFSRNTEGFEYKFEGVKHQYHPDFLLEDGTYVEIKGWYDKKTLIKHESFRKLGYKLIVIDVKTIDRYLNYTIEKYGKDFIRLYEEK